MAPSILTRSHGRRRGFTMAESLVAIAITAIAGSALLTSIASSVGSSTDAVQRAVAHGLAEQLMEEISATRFPDATNSRPADRQTRKDFDDIDDYHDWSSRPPVERAGDRLGNEGYRTPWGQFPRIPHMRPNPEILRHFTRQVTVERILPDTDNDWRVVSQHTNWRRVIVRVTYTEDRDRTKTLAEISRIYSYVPVTP